MIGRKNEFEKLQSAMDKDRAQLIAVYGRRRMSVLVTTYGLKRNEYASRFNRIVTMEDLFLK